MPTYKVRDNQTGKVVRFQWNGSNPPTDADMEEIFTASRSHGSTPGGPPSLRELIKSDAFRQLPDSEKLKGLREAVPGFSDLPISEQNKALLDFVPRESTPITGPSLSLPGSPSISSNIGEIDPSLVQGPPPRGLLPLGGSLLLGGVGAVLGGPGAAYAGDVAGAGLGSLAEDYLYGKPAQGGILSGGTPAKNALDSMILAGISTGAGAGVERATTSVGRQIPEDARIALQYARANRLPISVSEVSSSWIAKLFGGDIFALGRLKTTKYAKNAEDYLIGVRSKILENLTGAPETTDIPISAVASKVRPTLRLQTKEAYQEPLSIVKEAFGNVDPLVRLENTRRTAGELLQDVRVQNAKKSRGAGASPREWIEDFLRTTDRQGTGSAKFSDIHKLQSQINRVFYGATNEGGAPLMQSLAQDLAKWDGEVGLRLNEAYMLARNTAKNAFMFDTIYSTLRGATKVDRQSGSELLNGVLLKAKLLTPVKNAGWKTPEAAIMERLGKVEGQKVIDDLHAIADYAIYTQKLRGKANMKIVDPTTLLSGGGVPVIGSYLGLSGGIGGVAIPQGSSLALTVMLTGPGRRGFLRNFLSAASRPALKLGTRTGIQTIGGEARE